jgi:ribosomal protein S11
MADKIKVWFDGEGDFLEVRFTDGPGYMKATENDRVMERVSPEGKVIGFSIFGVSEYRKEKPLEAELHASA